MLINQDKAISTSQVLLVPYEPHHVPTYHSWMKDVELQAATASEPLSLPEEYAMQKSWRDDSDKLTFIICVPRHRSGQHASEVTPESGFNASGGKCDVSERMLGDVNLFLMPADEDDAACIGEIEVMIASVAQRRQGYGRATVLAFMHYIQLHLPEILQEYASGGGKNKVIGKMNLLQLRVKIGGNNESSINLFESVGFIRVGQGENYFGEVELCVDGFLGEMRTKALLEKWNVEEYEELTYNRI